MRDDVVCCMLCVTGMYIQTDNLIWQSRCNIVMEGFVAIKSAGLFDAICKTKDETCKPFPYHVAWEKKEHIEVMGVYRRMNSNP